MEGLDLRGTRVKTTAWNFWRDVASAAGLSPSFQQAVVFRVDADQERLRLAQPPSRRAVAGRSLHRVVVMKTLTESDGRPGSARAGLARYLLIRVGYHQVESVVDDRPSSALTPYYSPRRPSPRLAPRCWAAKETTVVVPPNAARRVALSKVSAFIRPPLRQLLDMAMGVDAAELAQSRPAASNSCPPALWGWAAIHDDLVARYRQVGLEDVGRSGDRAVAMTVSYWMSVIAISGTRRSVDAAQRPGMAEKSSGIARAGGSARCAPSIARVRYCRRDHRLTPGR